MVTLLVNGNVDRTSGVGGSTNGCSVVCCASVVEDCRDVPEVRGSVSVNSFTAGKCVRVVTSGWVAVAAGESSAGALALVAGTMTSYQYTILVLAIVYLNISIVKVHTVSEMVNDKRTKL